MQQHHRLVHSITNAMLQLNLQQLYIVTTLQQSL
jgi:hypothetical protein